MLEEGNGNPLQVFLPGDFHDQMSLVGYRPWDHKELGMSEQLTNVKEGATKGYVFNGHEDQDLRKTNLIVNKQVKMLYNPLKICWILDLNLVYSRSIDVYLLALKSHMLDIFVENEFMRWKLILFFCPRKFYTTDEMRYQK